MQYQEYENWCIPQTRLALAGPRHPGRAGCALGLGGKEHHFVAGTTSLGFGEAVIGY